MSINACLVIPVYNHGAGLTDLAARLKTAKLDCIIVNDGSDHATVEQLTIVNEWHDFIEVVHHDTNQGKGAACMTGMRHAHAKGYTHAIQVDADGQHDLDDLPRFLEAASAQPDAFIMGKPVFDDSIPKVRFYGRYLTHTLVWLECLSTALKDTMCGYRVYPLESLMQVLSKYRVGRRMDFDTEIAVRMYWEGIRPVALDTKVTYALDSISHFRMFRDNVLISLMHTRLILGMLARIPRLLQLRHVE